METLQKIALIFTVIGAINWGLIGFFDFNLVTALCFHGISPLLALLYINSICNKYSIIILPYRKRP